MNRGRFRNNRSNPHRNNKKVDKVGAAQDTDDNNPVVKCFRGYADELNDKHDRHERIVKHSRDITIESKRLIFLLHTVDMRTSSSSKIISDAFVRLNNLCSSSFLSIAKELYGYDPYQYARAYSAGLQEFIEAFTYYDYMTNDNIMDWNDLQQKLTYTVEPNADADADASSETSTTEDGMDVKKELTCLVQPIEFMLGLADLSGEIMRKCINALGSGDIDTCYTACHFIQHLYSG